MPNQDPTDDETLADKDWKTKYQELEKRHIHLLSKVEFLKNTFLFWGLPKKIEEYREKATTKIPFPQPETDNLLAALSNRALIGSALGILLSIGTITILLFQTVVFNRQAEILNQQLVQNSLFTYAQLRDQRKTDLQTTKCTLKNETGDTNAFELSNALYLKEHYNLPGGEQRGGYSREKIKELISKATRNIQSIALCDKENYAIHDLYLDWYNNYDHVERLEFEIYELNGRNGPQPFYGWPFWSSIKLEE